MPDDVVALLERAEAAAFEDMYAAAPASIGATARRVDGALVIETPALPVVSFNRAFAIEALTEELLALPTTLQIAPHVPTEALVARGLTEGVHWAKVIRDPTPPARVNTGLEVRELEPGEGEEFGRVVAAAFEMPPLAVPWLAALIGRDGWRIYGSYDGERMVGAGALHLAGAVAWLGIGATLASHRGRGGQGAVMARRIADAIAAGCTILTTETGILPGRANPSLKNMHRAGFTLAYERANWSA